MFASSDTVCVDSQPGGLTLLENLHISCSQDHAQLVAAGRVAVHACTFTRTGGSNRPAVSAVGGQLSMADCTIDGNTCEKHCVGSLPGALRGLWRQPEPLVAANLLSHVSCCYLVLLQPAASWLP